MKRKTDCELRIERRQENARLRAQLAEAEARLKVKLPGMAELDAKLADHDEWLRAQRMMRVAIAPVAVEGVGDLLREMRNLCAAGLEVESRLTEAEARLARLRPVVAHAIEDADDCGDKRCTHILCFAVRKMISADRAWALGSEQEGRSDG